MRSFPDPLHDDYLDAEHCGAIWDDAGEPVSAEGEWEDAEGVARVFGWSLLVAGMFWGTVILAIVAGFLEMWRW